MRRKIKEKFSNCEKKAKQLVKKFADCEVSCDYLPPMKPETITKWLKTTGKDRVWLADQCQVAKSTVNGWLAAQKPRPIPKPSLAIIAGLMYSETPISPKFTLEQFASMQTAALKEGKTLEDWISSTVLEKLAKTILLCLLLFPLSCLL